MTGKQCDDGVPSGRGRPPPQGDDDHEAANAEQRERSCFGNHVQGCDGIQVEPVVPRSPDIANADEENRIAKSREIEILSKQRAGSGPHSNKGERGTGVTAKRNKKRLY